jgi:hypothetical protein
MAGANVRAVVNATDNPNGLVVPDPANANHLLTWALTGAGSQWEPLVIVWTAPSNCLATVSIAATNIQASSTTNISLDHWDGATLTVLDGTSLTGLTAYTLSASLDVEAGDEIHIWRDMFTDQQGWIGFSGTVTWSPSPLPAGTVIVIR